LEAPVKLAKVFKHGNSQAVRLPKEFRFDADEVVVKRTAAGVLLMPKKITLEQLDAVLGQFRGRFVRRQPSPQRRRWR
jgi:antitoxin VapB